MSGFSALILAGSRGGRDAVADYAGVSHKALIPIGGRPMILEVIAALRQAGAGRIAVSAGHPDVIVALADHGVEILAPADRPSLSVLAAFDTLNAPLLVTTADHALLKPKWIAQLISETPAEADLAVTMAERRVIEADVPETRRTYFRFADGHWSGCNLFWLATPQARAALTLWSRLEAQRKHPWRIARLLGPMTLLRYVTGRLTLAEALARLGRSIGVRAALVESRYGLAAVDVDKPSDLDLVRSLIR